MQNLVTPGYFVLFAFALSCGMAGDPWFLLTLRMADLDGWWLRLECCNRAVDVPCRLLGAQQPRMQLVDVLRRLRCKECLRRPGRATLLDDAADRAAGRMSGGSWRIEITLPDPGYRAGAFQQYPEQRG